MIIENLNKRIQQWQDAHEKAAMARCLRKIGISESEENMNDFKYDRYVTYNEIEMMIDKYKCKIRSVALAISDINDLEGFETRVDEINAYMARIKELKAMQTKEDNK